MESNVDACTDKLVKSILESRAYRRFIRAQEKSWAYIRARRFYRGNMSNAPICNAEIVSFSPTNSGNIIRESSVLDTLLCTLVTDTFYIRRPITRVLKRYPPSVGLSILRRAGIYKKKKATL